MVMSQFHVFRKKIWMWNPPGNRISTVIHFFHASWILSLQITHHNLHCKKISVKKSPKDVKIALRIWKETNQQKSNVFSGRRLITGRAVSPKPPLALSIAEGRTARRAVHTVNFHTFLRFARFIICESSSSRNFTYAEYWPPIAAIFQPDYSELAAFRGVSLLTLPPNRCKLLQNRNSI